MLLLPVVSNRAAMTGALSVLSVLAAMSAYGQQVDQLDCASAAPDAEPNTQQWFERDAINMACAQQRHADAAQHPLLATPIGEPVDADGRFSDDPYRAPSLHDGIRFRFDRTTVTTPSGQVLQVEVYRPCDVSSCSNMPAQLSTFSPPYPAVISVHGGGSRKELHWWSSQPLAESGYMVISADDGIPGTMPTEEQAKAVLDWLLSDENHPNSYGEFNAWYDELAAAHIGMAGHSIGGSLVSRFGQQDERISAIVAWDRAQTSPMPGDLAFRAPVMFQFADYNCQQVPVCQPEPYLTPPDPDGPGDKKDDFVRARAAGVDSMQIPLRAATHLDWNPPALAGSRYAESTSLYYTLAWFDRYLRGAKEPAVAADAYARLSASVFDDSADIHNISQGFFDPVLAASSADPLAGNVPYSIVGMPVADRLSFYYRSKCRLTRPGDGALVESDDLRGSGCGSTQQTAAATTGAGAPNALVLLMMVFAAWRRLIGRGTSTSAHMRRSFSIQKS